MKSVGNIAKITKAMKMVAASRLRGVQIRMEQSRGLPQPMLKLLGDAPGACTPSLGLRTGAGDAPAAAGRRAAAAGRGGAVVARSQPHRVQRRWRVPLG
jgi:hypothetical protein